MHSDEYVQTGFLSQDNFLNAKETSEVTAPIEEGTRRWGTGPKPAAAYSFSEAIDVVQPQENVQIGWMDDDILLTSAEVNGILGNAITEMRPKKKEDKPIDWDHASFSQTFDAV